MPGGLRRSPARQPLEAVALMLAACAWAVSMAGPIAGRRAGHTIAPRVLGHYDRRPGAMRETYSTCIHDTTMRMEFFSHCTVYDGVFDA